MTNSGNFQNPFSHAEYKQCQDSANRSSSMMPTPPLNRRSAQPTGPGLRISNIRKSTNPATRPSQATRRRRHGNQIAGHFIPYDFFRIGISESLHCLLAQPDPDHQHNPQHQHIERPRMRRQSEVKHRSQEGPHGARNLRTIAHPEASRQKNSQTLPSDTHASSGTTEMVVAEL